MRPTRHLVPALVLLAASHAPSAAQPAPPTDEPPPIPGGHDGWPEGVALDDLRGLPPCTAELPLPPIGEPIRCRPAVPPRGPQWSLDVEWSSGWRTPRDRPTPAPHGHGAHGIAVEAGLAVHRALAVVARYEHATVTRPGTDAVTYWTADHALLGVRARLFTDETERNSFTLGAAGGWAWRADGWDASEAIVRASVGREVGAFTGSSTVGRLAWELIVEQGLGEARQRSVLGALRFGFEGNVRAPRDYGEATATARWPYVHGVRFMGGQGLGVHYVVGTRLVRSLQAHASAGFTMAELGRGPGAPYRSARWGGTVGLHLDVPRARGLWPYVSAHGGVAFVDDAPAARVEPIVEAEVGLSLGLACHGTAGLGMRLDAEPLGESGVVRAGFATIWVRFGPGTTRAGCPRKPVRERLPAPPTPVTLGPPPTVTLEGGAVLGGAVRVLDVALATGQPLATTLPWAELRAAARVELEVRGPATTIDADLAELSAALRDAGLVVHAWRRLVDDLAPRTVRLRLGTM